MERPIQSIKRIRQEQDGNWVLVGDAIYKKDGTTKSGRVLLSCKHEADIWVAAEVAKEHGVRAFAIECFVPYKPTSDAIIIL